MKKKILFLSPLPPPHYGSAMSSEMCLGILKGVRDFEVRDIRLNIARDMNDVGRVGIKKLLGVWKTRNEIKRVASEFRPDLVYFVPATSSVGLIKDFLFSLAVKKYCKNILYHVRSRVLGKKCESFLLSKMLKGSRVIILDELLRGDVSGFVDDKNIFPLPNAIKNSVSVAKIKKIIKNRNKGKGANILFISNMFESKGWLVLLKSCKMLKERKINFVCNFVGPWPSDAEEKRFFDFVSMNGLSENVKYLGKKTGEEKDELFEKSNVFVFPTYYEMEAHPRVVLEAMMFGLPIIANNWAAIPSTIENGKTGFIVKDNSVENIANHIEDILGNKKKAIKMGELGRKKFLEKYEVKKYETNFIGIIKDCLN